MASVEIKGGEKIAALLNKMAAQLGVKIELRVGYLEGSTTSDGVSVPMIAAIQNFGAPGAKFPIPPRPFFSNMVKDKSPAWPKALALNLKAQDYDVNATMRIMGEAISGQLKQAVIDTNSPPLSPVTVMLRGMRSKGGPDYKSGLGKVYQAIARVKAGKTDYGASKKPLIDTPEAVLVNRVDYEIKE